MSEASREEASSLRLSCSILGRASGQPGTNERVEVEVLGLGAARELLDVLTRSDADTPVGWLLLN